MADREVYGYNGAGRGFYAIISCFASAKVCTVGNEEFPSRDKAGHGSGEKIFPGTLFVGARFFEMIFADFSQDEVLSR